MSVLVVGISHKVAPVSLLERAVLSTDQVGKLLTDAVSRAHVAETVVVATCNRIEIYADVERFHGGVDDLTELLAWHTGVAADDLLPHLYVRYEDGAVAHLFGVACGLDSMVVGETQILGQVKTALRTAQEIGSAGPAMNGLFQYALRVGKRAHTETELGRAGRSLVSASLTEAFRVLGEGRRLRALVVGAGSLASLAAITLHRDHGIDVLVANRTPERAARLAAEIGGGTVPFEEIDSVLGSVDLVLACTGALGLVLPYENIKNLTTPPRVLIDLAMPRDIDERVAELSDITLIDLDRLATTLRDARSEVDQSAVRSIVAEEVGAFVATRQANTAAPTIVALRQMAADVVAGELRRLEGRLPELDEQSAAEVEKTVRRVVDKLLHAPTVRVKELSERPVRTSYADALRELFSLDPSAASALEERE